MISACSSARTIQAIAIEDDLIVNILDRFEGMTLLAAKKISDNKRKIEEQKNVVPKELTEQEKAEKLKKQ